MEIISSAHCPHSQKVSEISGLLAAYAGLPPDTAELIRQVALYHNAQGEAQTVNSRMGELFQNRRDENTARED